jgi:hypothetical protein
MHLARVMFWALHFCFGPQHAVVVLLKQQFVPGGQQTALPDLAGSHDSHGRSHGLHWPLTHRS